jgi:hypothetical protein
MAAAPLDPPAIFAVLAAHGVDYVVIGGLASVMHGSPVVTNDVDVMPADTRDNLARLAGALLELDARVRSPDDPDGVAFDPHPDLLASMKMLNLQTRHGNLDVVFAPAGVSDYQRLAERATRYDIDGVMVAVAELDDIIASKRAADRPRDRAVLPILEALRQERRRSGP